MFNLKKSVVIGVAVTPENGLEVAQIDYDSKTVLKYGHRPVDYNLIKREIADLDLFKDSLQELLEELEIPKGSELILSLPTINFKISDYPASLDDAQVAGAIEDEVYDDPLFQGLDPLVCHSVVSSTLQFNKIAYSAVKKTMVIELILAIQEMGYVIRTIDTSLNSMLHSLIYLDRVNTEPNTSWVLLTIENNCCRVLSMIGNKYLDAFEEKISIGQVLTDAENYATVVAAVDPILKNLPAKYLCIVSKTNVISAEVIANKITYTAPIIYQEANSFRKEELIDLAPMVNPDASKTISLDIIGVSIYKECEQENLVSMNFFNSSLGDIYWNAQPPSLFGGKLVLTNEKLTLYFIVYAIIGVILLVSFLVFYVTNKNTKEQNIQEMERKIGLIDEYLNAHKDISTEEFDEGDEIRIGLVQNKNVYSYYTIVGTDIPQKLWLTHLKLGDKTTIEGQADNIESIYGFFRSIKDYNENKNLALQKLSLATINSSNASPADTESLLTTLNADFYEFCISDDPNAVKPAKTGDNDKNSDSNTESTVPSNNELLDGMEPIN